MTLTETLQHAELSVAHAPWPDTRYQTVRRLSNAEAAEKAAATAKVFYQPLLDAMDAVFAAEEWAGGMLVHVDEQAMSDALDALGRAYDEITANTRYIPV